MKKQFLTSIEFTDSHLKVINAKLRSNGKVISCLMVHEIQSYSDEQIVQTLKKMHVQKKFLSGEVIASIPRRYAFLKCIKLPSESKEEIDKMLDLQVAQNLPYSREDLIYDYFFLAPSPGYTNVLTIIVPKDIIQRYVNILHQAGWLPQLLTISTLGLWQWMNFQDKQHKIIPSEAILVLNMDAHHSEACLFHDQRPVFSRQIPFGINDQNVDDFDPWQRELELTWQNRETSATPKQFFLVSNGSNLDILKTHMQNIYQAPVHLLQDFDDVPLEENLLASRLPKERSYSLTASLGVLLGAKVASINLLPQNIQTKSHSQIKRKHWRNFGAVLVLAFLLVSVSRGIEMHQRSQYLYQLEEKLKILKPQWQEVRQNMQKIEFLKDHFPRVFVLEIIDELQNLMPEKVSLHTLSFNQKEMIIQGYAPRTSDVNTLQRGLVTSEFFRKAVLQYANQRKSGKQEFIDFKMTCQLNLN